jgi:hypothetical protein
MALLDFVRNSRFPSPNNISDYPGDRGDSKAQPIPGAGRLSIHFF